MCNKARVVKRTPCDSQRIVIHYGTIAFGNQVMRDGVITLQQRLIYRNDLTAAVDAFWVYWTWKPWKIHGRKGRLKYLCPPILVVANVGSMSAGGQAVS